MCTSLVHSAYQTHSRWFKSCHKTDFPVTLCFSLSHAPHHARATHDARKHTPFTLKRTPVSHSSSVRPPTSTPTPPRPSNWFAHLVSAGESVRPAAQARALHTTSKTKPDPPGCIINCQLWRASAEIEGWFFWHHTHDNDDTHATNTHDSKRTTRL